jgi:polar amino acid transport system substrate-binding protein
MICIAASANAADKIGNCELTGKRGETPIANPVSAGELTVQVSLPAPVWWNGDSPENIRDGMEYCMAAEIAWRAGFDRLRVVPVDWVNFVSGKTSGYDLTLSEVSITEERKSLFDFSVPYFNSDIGVMARKGASVDEKSIREVTVGIQQGTTGAAFVVDKLALTNIIVYAERGDLFKALTDSEVDAVMTDTAITLSEEVAGGETGTVVGQFKTGESYGAAFQKGSANAPVINKIIQSMIDDGTMQKLREKYLVPAWGKDPSTIPYFTP